MLARSSSDAGTRLRRSKSTPTVHSYRASVKDPFNADVAQKHALAAATTAFVRAHATDATDNSIRPSNEISRNKSNASRGSRKSHFPRASTRVTPSYRESPPIAKTTTQPPPPHMVAEKIPPIKTTPGSWSVSAQSAPKSSEQSRPSSQARSLRPGSSISEASQQIRKARSMYYASSIQTGSPMARPPARYLTTPPTISPPPDIPLIAEPIPSGQTQKPRSSAVASSHSPRPPVAVTPDETVNKARDKFLQDFQKQHSVKHRPSLFLAPFRKRQDKVAPKADPQSWNASFAENRRRLTKSTTSAAVPEPTSRKDKRSISDTLKQKFKKVFRRSSSKASDIPVQQIQATRDYFSAEAPYTAGILNLSSTQPINYLLDSDDGPYRITSRSSSIDFDRHAHPRSSSRGSNRSLHSEHGTSNGASRIPSWGSSTVGTGTLTQRAMKRLTVIHEAKDSVGSEAVKSASNRSPAPKVSFPSGLSAFRDPMPFVGVPESSSPPVDPKRVFSALVKEIDASKKSQTIENNLNRTDNGTDVFVTFASRELRSGAGRRSDSVTKQRSSNGLSSDAYLSSSLLGVEPSSSTSKPGSHRVRSFTSLERAFRATIRTVTNSRSSSIVNDSRASKVAGRTGTFDTTIPSVAVCSTSATGKSTVGTADSEANDDKRTMRSGIPTAEQIETRVQKSHSRWKTPLDGIGLPVFRTSRGSSTVMNFTEVGSTETGPTGKSADKSRSKPGENMDSHRLAFSASPTSSRARPVFSPLSPSVYSRNTDGNSVRPADSVTSLNGVVDDLENEDGDGEGSAIIITSRAVKSYVIGSPTFEAPVQPTHSTSSSRDWKAWLSHEVSELGHSPSEEIALRERFDASGGHRRERANITSGDQDTPTAAGSRQISASVQMKAVDGTSSIALVASSSPRHLGDGDAVVSPASSSSTPSTTITRPAQLRHVSQRRVSSVLSDDSSPKHRPERLSARSSSSRMNERFPYIETGRRSSSNSAKLSRHASSLAGSGSSSSKSAAATPRSRIYSDFSAPSPNYNTRYGRCAPSAIRKGTLTQDERRDSAIPLAASTPVIQPFNLSVQHIPQARLSHLSNVHSSVPSSGLSRYAKSTENIRPRPSMNTAGHTPPRLTRARPASPTKITMRPKSAFDLRPTNAPVPPNMMSIAGAQPKSMLPIRKPAAGCGQDGEVPRKLQSSTTAMDLDEIRMKSSSGSLVSDQRYQSDTATPMANVVVGPVVHEEGAHLASRPSSATPSERIGSTTPGQRMADRFLREREAGNGAGTPLGVGQHAPETIEAGVMRSRTCTPAFL